MNEITRAEVNAASAGVLIFAHSIEKFVRVIEEYYVQDYMRRKDYQLIVNKYYSHNIMQGMSPILATQLANRDAERYLRKVNRDVLETKSDLQFVPFLKTIETLKEQVERFSELGMEENVLPENEKFKAFDYMMEDADRMCRVFGDFQNMDGREDDAEDALKAYKAKDVVSDEFKKQWYTTKM